MITTYTNAKLFSQVRTKAKSSELYPSPWVYLTKELNLDPDYSSYMSGTMMKLSTLLKMGITERELQDSVIDAPTSEDIRSWIYDNMGVFVYIQPVHVHEGIRYGFGQVNRHGEDLGVDYENLQNTWRLALNKGLQTTMEEILDEE